VAPALRQIKEVLQASPSTNRRWTAGEHGSQRFAQGGRWLEKIEAGVPPRSRLDRQLSQAERSLGTRGRKVGETKKIRSAQRQDQSGENRGFARIETGPISGDGAPADESRKSLRLTRNVIRDRCFIHRRAFCALRPARDINRHGDATVRTTDRGRGT